MTLETHNCVLVEEDYYRVNLDFLRQSSFDYPV
jgi:hypothetical protein